MELALHSPATSLAREIEVPIKDRAAKATYMRDYYARNRTKQQDYQKRRAAEHRRSLAVYKAERGCRDCSESDPRVLQFHHRDGDAKEFTIGSRCGRRSLQSLLAEAEKCDVLCANCHIKEHVEPY